VVSTWTWTVVQWERQEVFFMVEMVRRAELGVDKSIKKPPLAFQAELRQCRENPRVPELEKGA